MTKIVQDSPSELDNIGLCPPALFDITSRHHSSSNIAFIALHAGAGFLHPSQHSGIQVLLQSAINAALRHHGSADEAMTVALSVLESSPLTNAAMGSCLTEDGLVECEASIVMGNGSMGSVGVATGIDHAIQVAHRLASERNDYGLIKELGRVRPICLMGEGVYRYAQSRGLGVAARDQMDKHNTTQQTRMIWRHYKEKINNDNGETKQHEDRLDSLPQREQGMEPQGGSASSTPDTIGAIACDYWGRVYAGTSSGGIWMKSAGRLGSSAVPGAGCYAVNGDVVAGETSSRTRAGEASVAVAVSGCGEDIMEQFLALECCRLMRCNDAFEEDVREAAQRLDGETSAPLSPSTSSMHKIMRRLMVKEQTLPVSTALIKKRRRNEVGSQDTLVEDGGLSTGLIALKAWADVPGKQLDVHFSWGHTARHFALAFASANDFDSSYEGKAWVSAQQQNSNANTSVNAGEVHKTISRPTHSS